MVAILAAAFFIHFLNFISNAKDKEVASQLAEVYGQVSNQFSDLSEKSWNILYDGSLTYSLSEDEELMRAYVGQMKVQWKFNAWLFVDDGGNYVDSSGHAGYLNLGKDFERLTEQNEKIVVDGTLAGSEPVLLFAIPVDRNVYKGFEFSAVALAYTKDSLKAVMDNDLYGGNSGYYLIYPDGRILLSLQSDVKGYKNLFSFLKQTKFEDASYEEVKEGIQTGKADTYKYTEGKQKSYLYYQPVGFQDWMLVGIVPQEAVGIYVAKILQQTVVVSGLCFGAILLVILGILYYRRKYEINQMNREVQYRDRLFDILSNNTANMFLVMSPGTYKIEYASPNSKRLIGVDREQIMKDTSVLRKTEYVEKGNLPLTALNDIPLGSSVQLESIRQHEETKEQLWFEEQIYHVEIEGNERFIFILQDRTKERESKKNLSTALDIARAANESKSEFLSNMSHDIRTPMNVIIGFLPLLQRDAENPEKVREYARKIGASSRHLLGLINDILDMSRIESGKATLNVSDFRLADMVDSMTMIIRPQAEAKRQSFEIYVKDIKYENLVGDSMKISQIMVNILSNAVKYTEPGGKIEFTVQQLPQMTQSIIPVRFTVKDNGIGMSEEYQKVIFEPFTREENHPSAKARGTGLGMSIVKNLVDLMGGSITMESKIGKGSTFTVDLGLRIQKEDVDAEFWARHSLFRTLVVDDDQEICSNIVRTVHDSGLEMEYALSGKKALDMVQKAVDDQREFNLVLLDWKMPEMDGLETASRIRKIVSREVPILILTAYDWSDIEEEARKAGIDGFLSKPFFLSGFKDVVEQICGTHEEKAVTEYGVPGGLDGIHCLVAEDFELNAEILAGILELYGASCEVRENGLEAVRAFEASEPGTYDLILMDIQMPVMNGCEATSAIRASGHPEAKTIPIIAMSANAFAEDIQEALQAGMDAYLTKPVDAKLLETTLVKIMEERK